MHELSTCVSALAGGSLLFYLAATSGCGSKSNESGFAGTNNGPGMLGGADAGSGSQGDASLGTGGKMPGMPGMGTPVCPPGLSCASTCSGAMTTTLSGKVYDPAKKNPLYNVAVFVPQAPLSALPKGVPTGTDACSCDALYKSGAYTSTATGVDGSFTLKNVPVGSNVPIVIQVGKWRSQFYVNVTACQDNPQPDKSLAFATTVAAGDTDTNIPDIAVSTGGADTLECLMTRMGLDSKEYVPGAATTGHVHIYNGGSLLVGGAGAIGGQEFNGMQGAPASDTSLWSTQAQLMPYDVLLLSCEGGETYDAKPAVLESYLNAGGRAFASHFHYAWFAGPLGGLESYSAPADWGKNLATWSLEQGSNDDTIGGTIQQTLNGSSAPFPKGVALNQWLKIVGALGQDMVPATELSIWEPRYNAVVGAANKPSQPWITADQASVQPGSTMYFSFDTPVTQPPAGPDGTGPTYCGRAVFSDLHVSGNPLTTDTSPPPGGCDKTDLSPQEKALEFMLFDLSSCVIPDTASPDAGGVPQTAQ